MSLSPFIQRYWYRLLYYISIIIIFLHALSYAFSGSKSHWGRGNKTLSKSLENLFYPPTHKLILINSYIQRCVYKINVMSNSWHNWHILVYVRDIFDCIVNRTGVTNHCIRRLNILWTTNLTINEIWDQNDLVYIKPKKISVKIFLTSLYRWFEVSPGWVTSWMRDIIRQRLRTAHAYIESRRVLGHSDRCRWSGLGRDGQSKCRPGTIYTAHSPR